MMRLPRSLSGAEVVRALQRAGFYRRRQRGSHIHGAYNMNKYRGDFQDLQELVSSLGYPGEWSDIENGKQFRCENGAILNWYIRTGTLQCQGTRDGREQLQNALSSALSADPVTTAVSTLAPTPKVSVPPTPQPVTSTSDKVEREKVFVVHGYDVAAREQLELVLHRLGLDPFVLANTGGGGLTIIEALENEIGPNANQVRFGIVLLTPDDMGYAKKDGSDKVEPRARQNVVLEMGMLIAAVRRPNVAILKKGHVEVPSDANGIIYIPFNDHIKETVPRLCDRLREAGFQLDPMNITRAST